MAKSNASTVQEYLDELPDDRRPVVEAVRKAILKSLPKGSDLRTPGGNEWKLAVARTHRHRLLNHDLFPVGVAGGPARIQQHPLV
jgi:hypothetical protein